MTIQQSITRPFGVTAFGSCVLRARPDLAIVSLSVSRKADTPAAAFAAAKKSAQAVHAALRKAGVSVEDIQSSRTTLRAETTFIKGERSDDGFRATTEFNVVASQLEELESLLTAVVDAGADTISSVVFQSRKLKELRAQARRRAVKAAADKAALYAEAAELRLGKAIHVEDVRPEVARRHGESNVFLEPDDEAGEGGAYEPGSIAVTAAVLVAYDTAAEPKGTGFQ